MEFSVGDGHHNKHHAYADTSLPYFQLENDDL
jgi:hypothetical protein